MHERKLVLVDSAYSNRARREELQARAVIDGIIYKRVKGQKQLYPWQECWNQMVAPLPARVEHANGMMKQLGYRWVKCRGQVRNAFDFAFVLIACNIKKSLSRKAA